MRNNPRTVLLISGVLGFWIGAVAFPTWAIPIESAQVVAGLVKYPPDNPFFIYHTRIWTLLIQIPALLLRAGVSEIVLSRALSGLLAMLSLQALAMITFALCGDAATSLFTALVVMASRFTDMGVVYPVMLIDTHHTYGALGLSYGVLALGLLGCGMTRSGAFLLGLAPAIHPSIGVWFVAIAVFAGAWRWPMRRRDATIAFAAGAAVTVVSFAVQKLFVEYPAHLDASVAATYFRAFVAIWDEHRRPARLLQPGVLVNVIGIAGATVWLWRDRAMDSGRRLLLRTMLVAGGMGLAASVFTWLPPERQPMLLTMLMPARLLNYNIMAIVPLMAAITGFDLRVALFGFLMLQERSMVWQSVNRELALYGAGIVGAVVIGLRLYGTDRRYLVAPIAGVAALLLVWPPRTGSYRDRTNDAFFATVASDRGMLLTAGPYQLVQLYTRRPVLIDGGGLDTVSYAPSTGPAMRRILRDVYGVDYFNPPHWAYGSAMLPHDYVRPTWNRFSPERWQSIKATYGVTEILARNDYQLQLPIVAEEGSFRLYRIP